jgi:hypothetical protein
MNRTLATAFLAGAIVSPALVKADSSYSDPLPMDGQRTALASGATTSVTPAADSLGLVKPLSLEEAPATAPAAPPAKKISGSVGATLTSKYISRGLILNNAGAIVQPFAEIDFDLASSKDGPINSISPYVGIWNDLTDNHRFAKNSLSMWYEFDWDVGVSITFLNSWNFNVQYIEFTSPSGAFGTAKNVIPQLTFDDSSLWNNSLAFGLHPYVAGLIETNGKAGSGAKLGYYVEPGINPSLTFGATGDMPITVTFPIKVGLGFNNFYGGSNASSDELFGYASAGAQVSLPIKLIDATLGGSWSATAGVAYYYYGSGTHAFNAANVGYTDRNDVIGSIGLLCKF